MKVIPYRITDISSGKYEDIEAETREHAVAIFMGRHFKVDPLTARRDNEEDQDGESLHSHIARLWSDLRHSHPQINRIVSMNDYRIRRMYERGNEHFGVGDPFKVWSAAIENVQKSRYLLGLGRPAPGKQGPFIITIDWLSNPENFRAVLSGAYNGRHEG